MSDTAILLCWLAAVGLLFGLMEWSQRRSERQFHRDLQAVIDRHRKPGGTAPSSGQAVLQPSSGERVGVTAHFPLPSPRPPFSKPAPSDANPWCNENPADVANPRQVASAGPRRGAW